MHTSTPPYRIALACTVVSSCLAWLGTLQAAPRCMVPTGEYLPTQPPYTYVLDRRSPYTPDYFDRYRTGSPTLIETGMLTPGHPYFGPMCDLPALRAGRPEKTTEECVRQYRENRARAPEAIRLARAAGAKWVITYICMMTTGGDPEKRTGFWRFYDNWDAFKPFHIPDRPPSDPENWQQRKVDGTPYIAYRRAHPPYRPMFRWTNCVNNPNWLVYQRWVTEEAARVGADGFFVDNAGTLRCYCRCCQTRFGEWLRSRYTAGELRELFDDDLSMSRGRDRDSDLRRAEVELFRQESIHRFLGKVREWGAAIRGRFFVFPNGLHRRGYHIATRFRDCDLAMHENSSREYGGNAGVLRKHVIAGLHVKHLNDHLLAFKYAAGTGARCRSNMFSYPGHPKTDLANLGANANAYALGLAGPAAFGGGGCYAPTRNHAWLGQVRATYNRFFRDNVALYDGKYPFGQVGLIGFVLPNYFGDRSAYRGVAQSLHVLMGRQILVDIIPERVFKPEWIARWPVLVVPRCAFISDSQLSALLDYAKQGGKLVLLGKNVGTRDQLGRERAPEQLRPLAQAATAAFETDLAEGLGRDGIFAHLPLCRHEEARLVRFAAYVDRVRNPTELVLHCVNMDVDLGTAHNRVGVVNGLELNVPLPAGTRAASGVYKAPGQTDTPVEVRNEAGRVRLTIPRLTVYGIVRLPLAN